LVGDRFFGSFFGRGGFRPASPERVRTRSKIAHPLNQIGKKKSIHFTLPKHNINHFHGVWALFVRKQIVGSQYHKH